MLTVVCVYWQGEFRKRDYSAEYVQRLRNMVSRNLRQEHEFICLTNVNVKGVECLPLDDNLPGWWSKVELFRRTNGLYGRCLYLDLDVLITGNLDKIADYDSPIAFCPPSYIFSGGKPAGGKGVVDKYQSSCIVWDAGYGREVYDKFNDDVMNNYRGDQDWMSDVLPECDLLPPQWFAKLKHVQRGPKKENKIVLSMPWKNSKSSKMFNWVRETWQ